MRQIVLFLTILIAFCGSFITGLVLYQERAYQLRGYVDPTQQANLPYRVPRFGVNVELTQYAPAELTQHLGEMEDVGVHWVRQIVRWDAVEPQRGDYAWSQWDRIFASLDEYPSLRPVIVFMNAPAWSHDNLSPTGPPSDPVDFAAFVGAFAARYGHQIDYYQIWDEPNLYDAWGQQDPRPADYVALLAEAYRAIHAADSQATVLLAALAPTTEVRGRNIADIRYLEDLYALGASDYFDAAAAKPYGFSLPPEDRTVSLEVLNFSRMIALREIMVANGDGRKALWASHWGWNHLPESWSGSPSIWGSVSQDEQIAYTLRALQRAEREWPWLGGMILHHWQPSAAPDDPIWGFALVNQDGQPTALYAALAQREQPSAASNGLYHPRSPFASYSGIWTFSRLGADIGWLETSDSQLAFDFFGRDVALWLREGDYFAFLYPQVDGSQANATPQDTNGNAYLLLRSPSREPELNLYPVSRGLDLGTHTLRVVADRGWDQWALAGYAVSDGDLAAPYDVQLRWLWTTSAAALIALLAMIYQMRSQWRNWLSPMQPVLRSVTDGTQWLISVITSLALMVGLLLTFGTDQSALFRRDLLHLALLTILSGGLILLQPGLLLAIVATLILLYVIYHRLDLGLALVIFYAPFFLFPVELYRFAFPMVEYLLLLTLLAAILRLLVAWGRERQSANNQYPLFRFDSILGSLRAMDYAMIVWGIVATLSLVWAERLSFALTEWRTLILEPVFFYALVRVIIVDRRQWLRMMDSLLVSGFVVSLVSLVMYLAGHGIITDDDVARLAGVYGSPNNVGLFLGRCLPVSLVFFVLPFDRRRRGLACVAAIVMGITVALTQSVGAILLGIPTVIVVIALLIWKYRALLPLLVLSILSILVVVMLVQTSTRFADLLDLTTGTNFIRLRVWESTLEIISDYPLTGLGLDQFLYAYRAHYIRPDAIFDPDLSHPHNIVMDFWVRLGLLGLASLAIFQVVFWHNAVFVYRTMQDDLLMRALNIAVMAIMANTLIHGLVDNSIYVIDLAYVFVFIMAAVVYLRRVAHSDVGQRGL